MYRALNESSYWWIQMNTRKTLSTSIDFPFQSPKISREGCFALSLTYAGLCKERSSKQVTDNFQRRTLLRKLWKHSKNQFSVSLLQMYSQQRYSILSYYYKRVTREGIEGLLSYTFLKIWRKCPVLEKGALILAIYVLNFPKCFPVWPYSFCPNNAIWSKIMKALKALLLSIICAKFSYRRSSFLLYCHIYRTLW